MANLSAFAVGWGLVTVGLVSGLALTPVFLRDSVGGGYASERRRLLRLGHIAFVALGMLNILAGMTAPGEHLLLAAGAVGMGAGCLVSAFAGKVKYLLPVFAVMLIAGAGRIALTLSGLWKGGCQ